MMGRSLVGPWMHKIRAMRELQLEDSMPTEKASDAMPSKKKVLVVKLRPYPKARASGAGMREGDDEEANDGEGIWV
eukprot:11797545-Alexandrium_andersonii.AAC.1